MLSAGCRFENDVVALFRLQKIGSGSEVPLLYRLVGAECEVHLHLCFNFYWLTIHNDRAWAI